MRYYNPEQMAEMIEQRQQDIQREEDRIKAAKKLPRHKRFRFSFGRKKTDV